MLLYGREDTTTSTTNSGLPIHPRYDSGKEQDDEIAKKKDTFGQWTDLDLDNSRVKLPRKKTAVPRDLPLWPETIKALKKVPRSGPLVFYTAEGHPWVRTRGKTQADGTVKYTTVNAISAMFTRLMTKATIVAPKGTGFYSLRRTAATLAARSGDPFAVQRLLGHVNLDMAT